MKKYILSLIDKEIAEFEAGKKWSHDRALDVNYPFATMERYLGYEARVNKKIEAIKKHRELFLKAVTKTTK